ncbi:metallophosphoesterase [Helicobacter mustelae]|nr:metallophosphoesterase [Helicobacter mustelae]
MALKSMENQHFNLPWMLVIVFIIFGVHLLIYYTFFHKIPGRYAFYGVGVLFLCNCAYILHHHLSLPPKLEFLFSICTGISFFLFVGAVLFYILISPFFLFASKEQCFLALPYIKTFCAILSVLGIVFSLYNGLGKKPMVKTLEIPIAKLKEPFSIAQISDLHLNALTKSKDLKDLIWKINALHPDAIMLTGDIIDAPLSKIREKLPLLGDLKARYGIYYVLGNHEYYHDTHAILEAIKNLGIMVLNNSSTIIIKDQKPLLNIIGITDLSGNKMGFFSPDINQAILKRNPNIPSILLSHQPAVISHLEDKKVDLILSGHTHGGQIFPFNFLVLLKQPYLKGLHHYDSHSLIYINQGTGFWGPPMRLFTRSEITFITLKPQE